jgi:hypothetical protein
VIFVFKFHVRDSDFKTSAWSNKRFKPLCVLVARKKSGVALRDSKDPTMKTLFFKKSEWNAFVKGVKSGEFD